jgi:hypothetical protein
MTSFFLLLSFVALVLGRLFLLLRLGGHRLGLLGDLSL